MSITQSRRMQWMLMMTNNSAMKINASVEIVTGCSKETVDIVISEDDIRELAIKKAKDEYYWDSARVTKIQFDLKASYD